jgi:hypothetical protein
MDEPFMRPSARAGRRADPRVPRRVGAFGTLLYTGHDWAESTLARRSMQLMAEEVWPRVLDGLR